MGDELLLDHTNDNMREVAFVGAATNREVGLKTQRAQY